MLNTKNNESYEYYLEGNYFGDYYLSRSGIYFVTSKFIYTFNKGILDKLNIEYIFININFFSKNWASLVSHNFDYTPFTSNFQDLLNLRYVSRFKLKAPIKVSNTHFLYGNILYNVINNKYITVFNHVIKIENLIEINESNIISRNCFLFYDRLIFYNKMDLDENIDSLSYEFIKISNKLKDLNNNFDKDGDIIVSSYKKDYMEIFNLLYKYYMDKTIDNFYIILNNLYYRINTQFLINNVNKNIKENIIVYIFKNKIVESL